MLFLRMALGFSGPIVTATKNIVNSFISNIIAKKSVILQRGCSIISAFSSVGGMIALIMDISDSSWDNYFTVKY